MPSLLRPVEVAFYIFRHFAKALSVPRLAVEIKGVVCRHTNTSSLEPVEPWGTLGQWDRPFTRIE